MKSFAERFDEILDFTGLSAYKLAKEIGTSESVISSIRSGKTKPSFDFLSKLLSKYEVFDMNYLLTGIGNLIKNDGNTPPPTGQFQPIFSDFKTITPLQSGVSVPEIVPPTVPPPQKGGSKTVDFAPYGTVNNPSIGGVQTPGYNFGVPRVVVVDSQQQENIVYVPVKARAGYLLGYGDPLFIQQLPTLRIPGLSHGTYRMFEVDGPSMAPNITSGDRVIAQWVGSMSEIRENRVHIVVTKDGVLVKRVLNRISERGKIVLKSDTITHRHDHPTFEIDPADILEIWYARIKLSSDFSEPAEIYHRVSDLEADMVEVKSIIASIKR